MPSFSSLGKFFGSTASTAAGFAAGVATAPTLAPLIQAIENEAWSLHPDKVPGAGTLALGVAQGQVPVAEAYKWATETGFGKDAMDALVSIANVGPPLGYAFEAWRRGFLTDAEFTTALHRTGLESQWYPALTKLKERLLDPADLARGIHKGLIPDPGLLAVPAPTGEGNVKAYPVYPIDGKAAAAGFGYTLDDLGVLVGLQGNPMGAHEAAQAQFRGIIQPVDYDRAIAEGNTRNEWGDAIREQSRQILTSHEYIEARLRGWLTTDAEMYAGTAKHGMTQPDTDLLFEVSGRPLSFHQVWIGLQRGGTYDGPTDQIDPAFLSALRQSNIRPEYYNLAWAQRYNYPAPFVLKALVAGGLPEADALQVLKFEGYEPTFAQRMVDLWGAGKGPTSDKHVSSSQTSLVTAARKAYVGGAANEQESRAALTAAGISAASQDSLLKLWDAQRALETLPPPPAA